MKKQIWIPILVIVVIVVAGLIYVSQKQPQQTGVIKIGWIGPQTGQSAVLGMDSFVAAQIAIDEINEAGGIDGRQFELIIEDDQYNTAKSVDAYEKLVNIDGVDFILANTYGSIFALAEKAKKDKVILIDPLDCNSELAGLNDNVFCLATDSESIAEILSDNAEKQGFDKVGILYWNSDMFMPLIKNVFEKEFDGEIVLSEAYVAGTKDFKTQLTKMINRDADAIVMLGYDETGIAMKQARELGFRGQFYATGTLTSPPLQEAAQGTAEGVLFGFWDAPKSEEPTKSFTESFIAVQGRPAILDLASYPSYDAVNVLALAIDNANSLNIKKVKSELLQIQGYKGVIGDVSFAEDGSARIRESVFKLVNGVPVKL
jgi:branched-chain amino acid transport system substrate-binding protein